ncbi:MAG: DUF4390 domain-containing protein [Gammaproteobacteria bacterium]
MTLRLANNLAFFFCLLMASSVSVAGDIIIDDASVIEINGLPTVRSQMQFLFSDSAIEALQSGVGLYIEFNLKVKRARRYLWDKNIIRLSKRIKIERHALTDRYIVSDLLEEQRRIFDSLEAAFGGINEMSDIPIGSFSELTHGNYTLAVRARLDIEALPAPLRPVAYVSPSWRMSSGWYEWNSVH